MVAAVSRTLWGMAASASTHNVKRRIVWTWLTTGSRKGAARVCAKRHSNARRVRIDAAAAGERTKERTVLNKNTWVSRSTSHQWALLVKGAMRRDRSTCRAGKEGS